MKVTLRGHPKPTTQCMACYQALPDKPVPVLSEWRIKTAPLLDFAVAGWTCCIECFNELNRMGLEADTEARNITQLAWSVLGLDAALSSPLNVAPEILAASRTHTVAPPAQLDDRLARPMRDGHLLISRAAKECRCLNCLKANPTYPVCTQVVLYGVTRDDDLSFVHPEVVKDGEVYVHTPTLITNTSEKFWLEHGGTPFYCYVVFGWVCGPDCAVWAVGAPGSVGWSLPPGELYYATNVLMTHMFQRQLPPDRPDPFEPVFRRAAWAGAGPALTLDPFAHMEKFNPATILAQERALSSTTVTPSLLSELLEKLDVADDIRSRIKRARTQKIPE